MNSGKILSRIETIVFFIFAARSMTMRRETIRALEVRKNSVMAEKRKSQMQTLGANNEYAPTAANAVRQCFRY